MDLKYKTYEATFRESDLIEDIAKSIRNQRPSLSITESRSLAQHSLGSISLQENRVYRVLVESGVNDALFRNDGGYVEPAI